MYFIVNTVAHVAQPFIEWSPRGLVYCPFSAFKVWAASQLGYSTAIAFIIDKIYIYIWKMIWYICVEYHQNDIIMSVMAFHITSLTIVYSTVYSDADQNIKAPCHWPLCGEFTDDRWPAPYGTDTKAWPWWRHQMETFSALLTFCAGNSPVTGEFPHKGQWRGALMFSLICAWSKSWANNGDASDLRRHRAHCDTIAIWWWGSHMLCSYWCLPQEPHSPQDARERQHPGPTST